MRINEQGATFAEWLLKQAERDDWIGTLARQAKMDRGFTFKSTPDDLRKRLHEAGAEGDHFEALDAAEAEWLGE